MTRKQRLEYDLLVIRGESMVKSFKYHSDILNGLIGEISKIYSEKYDMEVKFNIKTEEK